MGKVVESSSTNPEISVVIPAYNEAKFLTHTLKSLQKQSFKGNYEVIVADNNSSDDTAKIAKSFGAKVVSVKEKGVAYARQKGFEAAKGDIIASTDADTLVGPDWLEKINDAFAKGSRVIGVVGRIRYYGARNFKAAFINGFSPLATISAWLGSRKRYFRGANFAIRKSVFREIGGFNLKLNNGEDYELGLRAGKEGKIALLWDNAVYTSARRYATEKMHNTAKLYLLNYVYIKLFGKPYLNELTEFRTGHNKNITNRHLRSASLLVLVSMLIIFFCASAVYSAYNPRSQLFGDTFWHKKTHERIIALTFDDGPNEPYTGQVLDILKQYDIHATFFEVGQNVERSPQSSKRVVAEGNVIGNHSYSHGHLLALTGDRGLDNEIGRTQNIITADTGLTPRLIRPPHGTKSPFLLDYVKDHGMFVVEWSDMTDDYASPGVDKIVERILRKARPGGIIVMHDGDGNNQGTDRSQTVAALPIIIDQLQKQGYKFVTLPQLLGVSAYKN